MCAASGKPDPDRQAQLRAELRRDVVQRRAGYRERALKLFPHICGSCSREFSGKRLKELTVHHKDHDHTNNPPDGSNWELLCIYCHDHEHEKDQVRGSASGSDITRKQAASKIANPFDNLDQLLGDSN
jgi:hypothetical protein